MTSSEIVKRCVHFQNPPRPGLWFPRFDRTDTVNVFDFFIKDKDGVDPWGTTFVVHPDVPTIGIPKGPMMKSPADLGMLRAPDPHFFAGQVRERLAALSREDQSKYRLIHTSSGIWERVQYIRGMEAVFEDMFDRPELVHALVRLCADFWVAFLDELSPMKDDLNGIYMFDDWGTQQDVMISPSMWRVFFGAPYRRIVEAAHANGMDFWLHSCGRVTNLIGDFINVGMDVINPGQSGTCGYEEVAETFSGKVAFFTSVDSQSTLTHGTTEQVVADCKRLERWGTARGGLLLASSAYDTPEANERAVLDYFLARQQKGAEGR